MTTMKLIHHKRNILPDRIRTFINRSVAYLHHTRGHRRAIIVGLLFAGPWILGFLAFILYPAAASFYYSLTSYNLFLPPRFIGLLNYSSLFHDPNFWLSVENTVYIATIGLAIQLVVALLSALALNQKVRGLALFRSLYYLPAIVPTIASAMLFLWILNPTYGFVDQILGLLHLSQPGWFTSPAWAKPGLILLLIWQGGNNIIIYLAALQDVPQELVEAAGIDGANALAKFRHVVLPVISPVSFFLIVMGLITSLQLFNQPYILSGNGINGAVPLGNPQGALLFYSIYLFQNAFQYLQMGYASAQGWVLFLLILIMTALTFLIGRRWVHYD